MVNPQRLLSSSAIGALDQALLSAFNLALGVAFIKLVPKADYADYVLLTTALLLLQSMQNALVNSPLATLLPAAATEAKRQAIQRVGQVAQNWLLVGLLLMGGLGGGVILLTGRLHSLALLLAAVLAGLGVLSREYVRAQCFLRQDALAALRADMLYVLLAALGTVALLWQGLVSATPVIALIGAAGLLTDWFMRSSRQTRAGFLRLSAPDERDSLRALWGCARWGLPSVLNTWLYANAFLYLVERMMSKDAVAELSAARLLLVPMSLLVVGWSAAFRPRASLWLATARADRVHQVAVRSAGAFIGIFLLYGLLLILLMPMLQSGLLGDKYRRAGELAPLWLVLFTVGALRAVGMSAMLASPAAFRTLYQYGWAALLVALAGSSAACAAGSLRGVLAALVAAEVVFLSLIWWRGWPSIRHQTHGGHR